MLDSIKMSYWYLLMKLNDIYNSLDLWNNIEGDGLSDICLITLFESNHTGPKTRKILYNTVQRLLAHLSRQNNLYRFWKTNLGKRMNFSYQIVISKILFQWPSNYEMPKSPSRGLTYRSHSSNVMSWLNFLLQQNHQRNSNTDTRSNKRTRMPIRWESVRGLLSWEIDYSGFRRLGREWESDALQLWALRNFQLRSAWC